MLLDDRRILGHRVLDPPLGLEAVDPLGRLGNLLLEHLDKHHHDHHHHLDHLLLLDEVLDQVVLDHVFALLRLLVA